MCTGRVDLSYPLRAFLKGADGVIIGGCWPGECHYVTEGNYDALGNMYLTRKLLEHMGVNPDRLRLEWISAAEGTRFAEVMNDFAKRLAELGPLGEGEGLDGEGLRVSLTAANKLVPYMKLVERERLRVPVRTEEGYKEFFAGDEANRLFDQLIADKLALARILTLLEEEPRSTGQIAEVLSLNPSDVSRYMSSSSRQGLVRYDAQQKCYALA